MFRLQPIHQLDQSVTDRVGVVARNRIEQSLLHERVETLQGQPRGIGSGREKAGPATRRLRQEPFEPRTDLLHPATAPRCDA